jgi:hypothetical protein
VRRLVRADVVEHARHAVVAAVDQPVAVGAAGQPLEPAPPAAGGVVVAPPALIDALTALVS